MSNSAWAIPAWTEYVSAPRTCTLSCMPLVGFRPAHLFIDGFCGLIVSGRTRPPRAASAGPAHPGTRDSRYWRHPDLDQVLHYQAAAGHEPDPFLVWEREQPVPDVQRRASVDWAMNTSQPSGRSSRAASGIHRYGSHHADAPYSLITTSAQLAPSGAPLGVRLDQREVPAELILQAARDGQPPGRDVHHPTGRAPRRAGHAQTYPLAEPSSTATAPASTAGRTAAATGEGVIFPGRARRTHAESADRSNQGGKCSSHLRRVTGTCPRSLLRHVAVAGSRSMRANVLSAFGRFQRPTDARMAGAGSVESRW